MATHLGGMPPAYRLSSASGSPISSNELAKTRLFGPKDAKVPADSVLQAPDAAKKTFVDFLERLGESGQYAMLTSLTGD
jgi:hypothetical protein